MQLHYLGCLLNVYDNHPECGRHFEKLSVGCLSECYSSDEKKARLLLVRQMRNFGLTTVLQLAVKADNKIFIAHAACQALLNNIWRGRIAPDVSNLNVSEDAVPGSQT